MRLKRSAPDRVDVAMVGTFSAWRLGTLQARALPLAIELRALGIRCAIVTVPWDQQAERGVTDSIATTPLINTRHATVMGVALAVREQAMLIRNLHPRLVHVFKPKGFGAAAAVIARRRPLLVDSDDWEGDGGWNRQGSYSALQRRVFDRQERHLIRTADGVTAASTLLAHRARSLRVGRASNAVAYVPNGLPRTWFDELRGASTNPHSPEEGEPARLVLYSRFAEFPTDWLNQFVSRLAEIVDRPFAIDVIGESEAPSDTGQGYVEMNLMGYVAKNCLPYLLASPRIALYPFSDSLISRSKHSVKLLELMAAGSAIIASDVGEIPAVLDRAGILVSGTDARQFAESAIVLAGRPELRAMLMSVGQARVDAFFTTDRVANAVRNMYLSHWDERK